MHVLLLFVSSAVTKGGISTWTEQYLEGCEQAGLDCTLVNTAAIGEIAVHATSKRNLFDELRRMLGMHRQLTKALKAGSYDVAHFNTSIGYFGIFRDYTLAKRWSSPIPTVSA